MEESEHVTDLPAARSAGVEAAEVEELYRWLCRRNAETESGMSYHEYVQVAAVRELKKLKRVAVHLSRYRNTLERPVRPDEGREAADAG